ncbi:MAG: hypothetical protein RLZ56_1328 [Bacteroidota bacterium]|jgi:hypothetical protein
MQNKDNHKELQEDQAIANALLGKENLHSWKEVNMQVPHNYFNAFEANTLHKIQNVKPSVRIFTIGTWKKLAFAASIFAIVVSTYLLLPSNTIQKSNATAMSMQQIPNEEIAAYINENDWVAEVDWHTELNKEEATMIIMEPGIQNDSN